jgi:hypothetical protein
MKSSMSASAPEPQIRSRKCKQLSLARARPLLYTLLPQYTHAVSLAMTAVTRNLPWFVRDLGVSVVGEVTFCILCLLFELFLIGFHACLEMLYFDRRRFEHI